jgi:hypothetical protein
MSRAIISQERLKELLHYAPKTGYFTWRTASGRGQPINRVGQLAGKVNPAGYVRISIDGVRYLAHRLAYLYMTGRWPEQLIDHINGLRHDNSWRNLRDADHVQNGQNVHRAKQGAPLPGAYWRPRRNRWEAQLRIAGVHRHLGYHDTPEQAHAAYVAAKRQHHAFNTL